MKIRIIILALLAILFCAGFPIQPRAAEKTLDVFSMTEIPAGTYDVQLENAGKKETIKLAIKNNEAKFVKSTSPKFEGLSGGFELIGNGVFVARLSCKDGNMTQLWLFQPDGTAKVKENPDRGEKQVAKLSSRQ
jgi:hypothetical protein